MYDTIQDSTAEAQKYISDTLDKINEIKKSDARRAFIEQVDKNIKEYKEPDANVSCPKKYRVTNYLMRNSLQALQDKLYSKNPECSVTATNSAAEARKYAEMAEKLVDVEFIGKVNVKRMMRWLINNRFLAGVGAVKVILSENYKTDALMQQRADDVRRTIAELEAAQDDDNNDNIEEMRLSMQSLHENAQTIASRAFLVDKLSIKDIYVSMNDINDLSDYEDAEMIAQAFYLSKEEYKTRFGEECGGTTHTEQSDTMRKGKICVYEIWDKKRRLCYTIAENNKNKYLVEPYSPVTSERFYPFFLWVGDVPTDDQYPYSEASALAPLQREENERRGRINQIRSKFRPTVIYSKLGDLDKQDIENLLDAREGDSIDAVGLPLTASTISEQLWEAPRPSYDNSVFDSSDIYRDVEAVMRAGQANMGGMVQPKTATEANILNSTYQAGVSDHQDALETLVSDVFLHVIEVIAQRYTFDEIVRSTNDDEAIPFPQDTKHLYDMINIRVKAGSLIKPDKAQRVETWARVSGVVMQNLQMIMQAVQSGDMDTARLLHKLTAESIKRSDETLDPDEYLPNIDELNMKMQQQQQGELQQAQQQMQQMQQQMQQAQGENAELMQALQQVQAENEAIKQAQMGAQQQGVGYEY